MKKLINWATVPSGIKVQEIMTGLTGTLLEIDGKKACLHFAGLYDLGLYDCRDLVIAPAAQQPWLLYEDGVTIIPEWAEVTLKIIYNEEYQRAYNTHVLTLAEINDNTVHCGKIVAYRLGRTRPNSGLAKLFKDGWTDNRDEVKV